MQEQRLRYIQETGLFFDQLGITRTAGMVLGFLMSEHEAEACFETIRTELKISKGATSQTLKWLVENGFVEKTLKEGDRKTYYRFKIMPADQLISERIVVIGRLVELFEKGISLRGQLQDRPHSELENAIDTYSWIIANLRRMRDEITSGKQT